MQVENEYGSFGNDKQYLARILNALKNAGLGEAMHYTADGGDELAAGTLPELPAVVNFGPGDAKEEFAKLQKFRPGQPIMSGEYWDGWFDHWGAHHKVTSGEEHALELDWILSQGYSINLYMFHGGTSFGFMNGANWDDNRYEPDVTSYDYDSPVSESGALTKKYFAFRSVIAKHRPGASLPDPPPALPVIEVPEFELSESAPLWANLPASVVVDLPRNMESFGQAYGYILYRTKLKESASGDLVLPELRSYARIFIDGKLAGVLDRRKKQDHLPVETKAGSTLDILVEGTGRINFSIELRKERQGINGTVTLAGRELTGWEIYCLPMDDLAKLRFHKSLKNSPIGPTFYRGHFELAETGDTFLDTRDWGKGSVWINGHALGRFWNLGPQQTLYVPAPWLKKGKNDIVVFAQEAPKNSRIRGLRAPILDEVKSEAR